MLQNILNLTKERKTYFLRQEHIMPLKSRVCSQIVFSLANFKLFGGQGGGGDLSFLSSCGSKTSAVYLSGVDERRECPSLSSLLFWHANFKKRSTKSFTYSIN